MLGDRRIHERTPCMIGAVVRGDEGTTRRMALADVSEGGAFLPTGEPMRPGRRLQLEFTHPETGRVVQVGARVARRVGARGTQAGGNGLYFEQSLSELREERRLAHRERCNINSKVRAGTQTVNGALEDISETGALLNTPLAMRIGFRLRVVFRHPRTGNPVVTWAEVMRGPLPLPDGGTGYGVRFDQSLSELASDRQAPAAASSVGPTAFELTDGFDFTQLGERDFERHGLSRRAQVHVVDSAGAAEVVGGARRELLLSSSVPVHAGQHVSASIRRTSGRPLVVTGVVAQVGDELLGSGRPGFVLSIRGFAHTVDQGDWATFISWLKVRSFGMPLH